MLHRQTGPSTGLAGRRAVVVLPANRPTPVRSSSIKQQRIGDVQRVGAAGSGPTGLNVNGHRPTTPAAKREMLRTLRESQVKVLSPQEVAFALERGDRIVIDIRPEEDYLRGHIPNSKSVPFYIPISGWSPWQVARRVGYAAFGISQGTEPNPNFIAEVMRTAPDKEAAAGPILVCTLGMSTLDDTSRLGVQSRSLIAAYAMATQGYKNLGVLKGGYAEWANSGRDVTATEPAQST